MTTTTQPGADAGVEPRHETVSIGGLQLHYVDYGPPSPGAPDLLLLHGLTSAWGAWRRVAQHWSKQYRVLALDSRGHGTSQWASPDAYGTEDYVREVEGFVNAVDLRRFILVGQSMGGHTAIAYTARHPERILATIANDIPPSAPRDEDARHEPPAPAPRLTDLEAWKAQRRERNPFTPEWALDLAARETLKPVEGGYELRHDAAATPWRPDDLWAELPKITRPILFIRGGRSDVLSAQTLQDMDMAAPSARSVTLEKAGHSTFWDMEPEWIAIASAFLDAHVQR